MLFLFIQVFVLFQKYWYSSPSKLGIRVLIQGFFFFFFQERWCDSKGTLEDVKAKLQMRQEGAFKRERAIAYSLAQKVLKYVFHCLFRHLIFHITENV